MILQQIYPENGVTNFVRIAQFYRRYYKKNFVSFSVTLCILPCTGDQTVAEDRELSQSPSKVLLDARML